VSGLVSNIDIVILGLYRPAAELGYYRFAKQMVTVTGAAVSALITAAFRDLSELVARGQLAGVRARLQRIQLRSLLPAIALWGLTVWLASWLIQLIFGPTWGTATTLFAVLNLGYAAQLVLFWSSPLLQAKGETGFLVNLSLKGGVVTVVAVFAGAKWQGGLGTAAVMSGYLSLMNLASTRRLYRSLADYERDLQLADNSCS
jgi:O-antigen/teichoic acid export membrane protein